MGWTNIKAGIYCIENLSNNKKYIGLTTNLDQRYWQHLWMLQNNSHSNKHLQNSWNKYGGDDFIYYVLEICEKKEEILNEREKYWISKYNTTDNSFGYNRTLGGEINFGYKHTEEARYNMSVAGKKRFEGTGGPFCGKKHKKESKEKLSKIFRGEGAFNSKITWEDARFIRENSEKYSRKEFSEMYGISTRQVGAVINYECWRE